MSDEVGTARFSQFLEVLVEPFFYLRNRTQRVWDELFVSWTARSFKKRAKLKIILYFGAAFCSLYAISFGFKGTPRLEDVIRTYSRTTKAACIFVVLGSILNITSSWNKVKQFAYVTIASSAMAATIEDYLLWNTLNATMLSLTLIIFLQLSFPKNDVGLVLTIVAVDGLILSLILYLIPLGYAHQSAFSNKVWRHCLFLLPAGILMDEFQNIFSTIEFQGMTKEQIIFHSFITFCHALMMTSAYYKLLSAMPTS